MGSSYNPVKPCPNESERLAVGLNPTSFSLYRLPQWRRVKKTLFRRSILGRVPQVLPMFLQW
jgi:hypothetical protein